MFVLKAKLGNEIRFVSANYEFLQGRHFFFLVQ